MNKSRALALLMVLLLAGIWGCGELRYSQVAPEARDFHPRGIAVLPADTTAFAESGGSIDRIVAEALRQRKWPIEVVGGDAIGSRMQTDAAFRQAVTDYLMKLDKVSFSDPELSGRIGEMTGTEALLLVRVDYWGYTMEADKKVGKVGLSIRMIATRTGNTLWTATHQTVSDYLLIKPDLPDLAENCAREMIGYMPH